VADAVGKALLLPEDMKVWQEKSVSLKVSIIINWLINPRTFM
jgi:hypothetical protein